MKKSRVLPIALLVAWPALSTRALAQGLEQQLWSLGSTNLDAANPYAPVVQGRDGALYGTTADGGASGFGTVFRLSTNGTGYSVLHSFTNSGGDGRHPYGGLAQAGDGTLYGTTTGGGASGYGTVFKLSTNGTGYAVVHSLDNSIGDGGDPSAGLAQGRDGALYGTTAGSGTSGLGAVFKLSTSNTNYSVLHSFTNSGGDGQHPYAGLVQASDGALYGTTYSGGTNGYGTVFKVLTNASGYSVLYSFGGAGGDGANPQGGLIQGSDGALYGTTYLGGASGSGTLFKLATDGTNYSVLHSFTNSGGDGQRPYAGLVQGRDGALYGTTIGGGAGGSGTLFKISTDGSGYSVLYSFAASGSDGASPQASLAQGSDGALYGTTANGGTTDNGTVFRFGSPPLIAIKGLPDRQMQISLLGLPNYNSIINVTTDLVHWTTLTNFSASNGPVRFDDLSATNIPRRYYRVIWIPLP